MTAWTDWLAAERELRAADGLLRELRPLAREARGPWVERDGRRLLDLSSNDYLGLAGHPELIEAAVRAVRARGTGARASRLVTGHDAAHARLEERLAAFKSAERALVLGSGYLANLGVIAALAGRECAVVSDRANHASIVDGIRLSGARHLRYRHGDLDHLEAQLAAARRAGARRLLVVTDTVFSMDGDVAPLAEIVALKERYGAALLVDDAHGAGVLGPGGAGTVPALGLTGRVDLELGTFSKAFGGYGAFVAGAAAWIDRLVNACRTLIYSTGLPPAVVGAVDRAIDLVRDADDLRGTLQRHAERTRAALAAAALDTAGSTTQIVPVVVGANDAAVRLASGLERRGVLAVAIRPPTVPHGRARVRLSLTAALGDDDLEQALAAVVAEAGGGS